MIAIGVSLFIDFPLFKFIVPAFIIFLGVRILSGRGNTDWPGRKSETSEDELNSVLIFSGVNKKILSDNFNGGQVTAIFGGGEVDLSEVKTTQKVIKLELVAILGGLKLIVPNSWTVKSEGLGILGGYDNNTKITKKSTTELLIKGTAILGGVEVAND